MKTCLYLILSYLCLSWSAYANEGTLFLTTTPREAIIYVNGQIRADLTPIALKLSPGKYQLDIKKSGKQTVSFEVLIAQGSEIHREITLMDVSFPSPFEKEEINLLKIINPLRGQFETLQEFEQRRKQLLDNFNQAVQQHDPFYQAGIASIEKDSYDTYHGTLPISVQWQGWTKKFSLPDKSSIAILPAQVEAFWKEGFQKPVFLYFDMVKNEAVLNKIVIVGIGKEWTIHEVSGYLSIAASSELANLLTKWMEEYHSLYPNVNFEILLKKDADISLAFTEGRSHVGFMTREMTRDEISLFEKNYGDSPIAFRVALDALGIYVHHYNPLWEVTVPQLDAIFSTTRKCGFQENLDRWGKLNLEPRTMDWIKKQLRGWIRSDLAETQSPIDWNKLDIQIEGLNSPELLEVFREKILCGGEFKPTLFLHENSRKIIKKLGSSINSMGFAKLGFGNTQVKMVMIPSEKSFALMTNLFSNQVVNLKELARGQYPLARSFWLYVNKMPDKPLSPVINRLIKLILSAKGQKIVIKEDFMALSPELITEQLDKLLPK